MTFVTTDVLKRVTWKNMFHMFHEEKKPFKCDICDYSFSRKSTLKTHVASVHKGKKPFKCNICDATFSENCHMKRHVSKIHGGKKSWSIDTLSFWINFVYLHTICWFTLFWIWLHVITNDFMLIKQKFKSSSLYIDFYSHFYADLST